MKSKFKIISPLLLSYVLFFTVGTAQCATREDIINCEMDCVSNYVQVEKMIDWKDVCYLGTDTSSPKEDNQLKEQTATDQKSVLPTWETYEKTNYEDHLNNLLNEFELAPVMAYFKYAEPNFMKDRGFLYGLHGAYTHRTSLNGHIRSLADVFSDENSINVYKIEGEFEIGQVDYESEGTGTLDDIRDYKIEARVLVGYDIPFWENSRLTPILGIGFRYLNDDTGGMTTTTGASGYERESRYVYLPIGIIFNTTPVYGWAFGLNLEYDVFLQGLQKSHLEDVHPSLNTIKNHQKKGYGLRGSFRVAKVSEPATYFVEPYVHWWHIDDSEISQITFSEVAVGYGLEPENKSIEYGLRLGVQF